jgi:hypothetical protein
VACTGVAAQTIRALRKVASGGLQLAVASRSENPRHPVNAAFLDTSRDAELGTAINDAGCPHSTQEPHGLRVLWRPAVPTVRRYGLQVPERHACSTRTAFELDRVPNQRHCRAGTVPRGILSFSNGCRRQTAQTVVYPRLSATVLPVLARL